MYVPLIFVYFLLLSFPTRLSGKQNLRSDRKKNEQILGTPREVRKPKEARDAEVEFNDELDTAKNCVSFRSFIVSLPGLALLVQG